MIIFWRLMAYLLISLLDSTVLQGTTTDGRPKFAKRSTQAQARFSLLVLLLLLLLLLLQMMMKM